MGDVCDAGSPETSCTTQLPYYTMELNRGACTSNAAAPSAVLTIYLGSGAATGVGGTEEETATVPRTETQAGGGSGGRGVMTSMGMGGVEEGRKETTDGGKEQGQGKGPFSGGSLLPDGPDSDGSEGGHGPSSGRGGGRVALLDTTTPRRGATCQLQATGGAATPPPSLRASSSPPKARAPIALVGDGERVGGSADSTPEGPTTGQHDALKLRFARLKAKREQRHSSSTGGAGTGSVLREPSPVSATGLSPSAALPVSSARSPEAQVSDIVGNEAFRARTALHESSSPLAEYLEVQATSTDAPPRPRPPTVLTLETALGLDDSASSDLYISPTTSSLADREAGDKSLLGPFSPSGSELGGASLVASSPGHASSGEEERSSSSATSGGVRSSSLRFSSSSSSSPSFSAAASASSRPRDSHSLYLPSSPRSSSMAPLSPELVHDQAFAHTTTGLEAQGGGGGGLEEAKVMEGYMPHYARPTKASASQHHAERAAYTERMNDDAVLCPVSPAPATGLHAEEGPSAGFAQPTSNSRIRRQAEQGARAGLTDATGGAVPSFVATPRNDGQQRGLRLGSRQVMTSEVTGTGGRTCALPSSRTAINSPPTSRTAARSATTLGTAAIARQRAATASNRGGGAVQSASHTASSAVRSGVAGLQLASSTAPRSAATQSGAANPCRETPAAVRRAAASTSHVGTSTGPRTLLAGTGENPLAQYLTPSAPPHSGSGRGASAATTSSRRSPATTARTVAPLFPSPPQQQGTSARTTSSSRAPAPTETQASRTSRAAARGPSEGPSYLRPTSSATARLGRTVTTAPSSSTSPRGPSRQAQQLTRPLWR
jgi:hypothetical protein